MSLHTAQRLWRRWVQIGYWIAVTQWSLLGGRFFIFRDAPTWFVRLVARQRITENDNTDFHNYIDAARDERQTRNRICK